MSLRQRSFRPPVALAAAFTTLAAIGPTASAGADTLSLSVKPSNPTGLTEVTFTATGSASTPNATVIVTVDPAMGLPCPADPATDTSRKIISQTESGAGTFTLSSSKLRLTHGGYVACGWLTESGSTTTTAQQPLTIANPDKLQLSVAPSSLIDGLSAKLSIKGVADVQNPVVFVTRKPASGGACAANPGADRGNPLSQFKPVRVHLGSFSNSTTAYLGAGATGRPDEEPPGRYLLCGWLMDGRTSSTVPLAGPSQAFVTLTAPTGTLSVVFADLLTAGRRFAITTGFTSNAIDASLFVDMKRLPAHGPACAASHAGEPRGAMLVVNADQRHSDRSAATISRGGVYVACAWLEWVHGTIDGPFSALFVVAQRGQRPASYYGETSQHLPARAVAFAEPVAFDVIDGQIVDLTYWTRYTCTRPGKPTTHPVYSTTFPVFPIGPGGRFSDTYAQGSDQSQVSGRLAGGRATGSFSESYPSDGYQCRSGAVRFNLPRR
jgi:hypothetical protein